MSSIDHELWYKIEDEGGERPSRFARASQEKLSEREGQFFSLGGNKDTLVEALLHDSAATIRHSVVNFVKAAGPRVVFDISSFPKRYFFPIVRWLLSSEAVEDLVVTYTYARAYSHGPLAENHAPWYNLPTFAPNEFHRKPEALVVAAGFESFGLPEQVKGRYETTRVLTTFPPSSAALWRQWDFTRSLTSDESKSPVEFDRVDARDVPENYDHLWGFANSGKRPLALAPYGPKTLSLAMLLFAYASGAGVYYTQPKIYNPDYSSGVRLAGDDPDIIAYCIRYRGKELYTRPSEL